MITIINYYQILWFFYYTNNLFLILIRLKFKHGFNNAILNDLRR
jgi:hypothetical protein